MEKKLEDMSIMEKVQQLQSLVATAELEVEYAIQVKWMNDSQTDKNDISIIIQNARELFTTGRLDALDYDVRQAAYDNYNKKLDAYLQMFPEYSLDLENSSQGRRV